VRIIWYAVDVRAQEDQEGDAEGLQVCSRVGIVLIFNKRAGVVPDGPAADSGAHEADGVAAGANEGIELAEGSSSIAKTNWVTSWFTTAMAARVKAVACTCNSTMISGVERGDHASRPAAGVASSGIPSKVIQEQ